MNNKIIKKSYIYYTNGYKVREISRKIREDYSVSIPQNQYTQWFGKKKGWNKIPESQIRLMKRLYENVRNTEKICSYMNEKFSLELTPLKLANIAHQYNFKKGRSAKSKNAFITSEDEITIINKYKNGKSVKALMREYGFKTQKSITDVLKYHGIDPWQEYVSRCEDEKTYKDFSMDRVDSPFKSYYLALMATDGWMDEKNTRISISLTDEDCIDFISKNINCTYASYSKPGIKDFHVINLTSQKLYQEMLNLGIHPRKTHSLYEDISIPVPPQFYPHFIRGCIDGDGWVRKDGREFYIASASIHFIQQIKTILENLGMANLFIKEISNDFYWIRTASKANITILKQIYDAPFGMERKYLRINQ